MTTQRRANKQHVWVAGVDRREPPERAGTLLVALMLCATVTVLITPGRAAEPDAEKPNIVFIMADDLGYAHPGCYGGETIETPHIDRLAAEGMRFTQVYAGNNVCAPSRAVLMTGLHSGHTPVRGNSGGIPMRDEDVTVAEVLQQAGYAVGGYGKWGLGDARTAGVAHKQGFDEFFGYYDQVHAHSYYPDYLWRNDEKVSLPGNEARDRDGLTGEKRETYSADVITQRARAFIRRHKEEPFFCYVPTTVPHTELLVPEDSLSRYRGRFPEPNPYQGGHYAAQKHPRAAFAAMVTRLDREVGRIMRLLRELDLDRETIVFFTSDNGGQNGGGVDAEFFRANGRLRGYKGQMYEGGLRVPMIVRWPGRVTAGTVNEHVWYFADVLPTLAELAGARSHMPADLDGLSVVPTLLGRDEEQQQHDYLYWERSRFNRDTGEIRQETLTQAVRRGDWKAIRKRPGRPLELYNLQTDLGETTDVAGEHPDVVERMEGIMDEAHTDPPPQIEPDGHRGWRFR